MERSILMMFVPHDANEPIQVGYFTQSEMTRLIGGDLELIPFVESTSCYLNENGKALSLPRNERASRLCARFNVGLAKGDFIAGNMFVVGEDDAEGHQQDLDEHVYFNVLVALATANKGRWRIEFHLRVEV